MASVAVGGGCHSAGDAVSFLAIPWEPGPAWENAVYLLWVLPQALPSIAVQAVATWLWARRLRREAALAQVG